MQGTTTKLFGLDFTDRATMIGASLRRLTGFSHGEAVEAPPRDPRFGDRLTKVQGKAEPVVGSAFAATVDEVAEALGGSGVERLLVVAGTSEVEPSLAAIELVRRLAGKGAKAVVVNLTGGSFLPAELGLPIGAPGLADYFDGAAELAETIHRDRAGSAHCVPSGGLRLDTLGEETAAELVDLLAAFDEAYDRVVLQCDLAGLRKAPGLIHAEAAVLVLPPHGVTDADVRDIGAALAALGLEDLLVLEPSAVGLGGSVH